MTGASILDPSGSATGGGIGLLQTIKGGVSIDLIAPAGVVEAGKLGIRASGNLNIGSGAHTFNTQVQRWRPASDHSAIPITQRPNTVVLTMASKPTGRVRWRQR
jgi:hypothetical protein